MERRKDQKMTEKETITIPPVVLQWSEWFSWNNLKLDARTEGVRIPNKVAGVYEVRYNDVEERLTIGKASNLRFRIRQGLIKGKAEHSAGEKIRASEDTSRIVVRWAVTDRPSCVEEDLHKRHVAKFGKLPKYVEHT